MLGAGEDQTRSEAQRGLGIQFGLAVALGVCSVIVFSMWRRKWPRLYAARTFRRRDLPPLPSSMFGWMRILYRTTDEQVLEYAGLDAYVFLMFFRAAFDILIQLSVISFGAIGPLRWYYTGKYDQDDDPDKKPKLEVFFTALDSMLDSTASDKDDKKLPRQFFNNFFWAYPVFTVIFTALCLRSLRKYTLKVVAVRQEYLGSQNSITDRTIRITGVPQSMRTKQALTEYFANLHVGDARSVVLCHDWAPLDKLFSKRRKLMHKLERLWADYLGPTFVNEIDMENITLPNSQLANPATGSVRINRNNSLIPQNIRLMRPYARTGFLGLWGTKVDLIELVTKQIDELDVKIIQERRRTNMPVTHTAFITMESVHACQMAAQALLNPVPHHLLTHLAPAPHDVIWKNIYMSARKRSVQQYAITVVFLLCTVFMTAPFYYLSRFIDVNTIKRFVPWLAKYLEDSPWLETFVTQVLTTYIFTLLNIVVPYFNAYLSERQGYISREDVELSTVSKNFFYVFVNLFLVFTIGQNINTLLSFPKDTTKFATTLARSLRRLSAFYTNLIVLQGLGILPTRLLQAGSVLQFPFFMIHCKSARDYHELYKPSTLNYGILLPTSLLIFLLALMYSILSGRILFFGAVYFFIGYYVYKYQFLYSMVHPQHSTGRLWTLIIRRTCFGLGLFQIAMLGILVLQSQYTYVTLIAPMPFVVAVFWYDFEKFTEPLLRFIALDAIHIEEDTNINSEPYYSDDYDDEGASYGNQTSINTLSHIPRVQSANMSYNHSSIFDIDVESSAMSGGGVSRRKLNRRQSRTLDEDREQHLKYVNPNLASPLDGPWVGVEGNECIIANPNGLVRRHMSFDEWE